MSWLPGVVVLVAGLAAGLLIVRSLRRGKEAPAAVSASSLELRIADLEARRDDLYGRLREMGEGEGDRAALELAAARTLKDLDQLQADLAQRHPKLAHQREKEAASVEAAPAAAGGPAPAKHFVTGFAYGAGLLLLIGALVYWAGRDATPRPDEGGPMATPQTAENPHPGADLPPEVAERVATIHTYLEGQPDDLNARKELGYTYLGASRFVEAYQQAEAILTRSPEDPDGLYMQAVVRLTMGQVQIAEELLQRALSSDPHHVDALTASGIIDLQRGDYPTAIATWKRGLEAIGGSQPMIERLIALAEEGRPVEEVLGMPRREPSTADARPAQAPPPADAGSPDVFTVTLELAPGATPTPGSVLFVVLRGAGGGPPAAVKRVDAATFPLTLTLGQADSMMGAPVPEAGTITARLDADGSASTRNAGDLEASAEASLGDSIRLRLNAGT